MTENKKSYEWLLRGVLAKVGNLLDQKMGRDPVLRSSLATSELADRLRAMLDSQARDVPGKGTVVPHDIRLKLQWDKFSDESDEMIDALESELTIAAVDHINDSLYHTFAPVNVKASRDYFTNGVKLSASFDDVDEESSEIAISDSTSETVVVEEEIAEQASPTILVATIFGESEMRREIDVSTTRRASVGRSASNALTIDDASISKIHATIAIAVDGGLSVADTGSTNGTFVAGERIAFGTAVPFSPDDKVTFGSVDVRFALPENPVGESSEQ